MQDNRGFLKTTRSKEHTWEGSKLPMQRKERTQRDTLPWKRTDKRRVYE